MIPLTILLYTDNTLDDHPVGRAARRLLEKAADGQDILTISQRPLAFGKNIVMGEIGRSHLSLYRQIFAGCEAAQTDLVALAEHDVFYTGEHFSWRPPNGDLTTFWYNLNCWFVNAKPGDKSFGKYSNPWGIRHATSQLICGRELLMRNLEKRIGFLEKGWTIRRGQRGACEPGVHEDLAFIRLHDDGIPVPLHWARQWKADTFQTVAPNLDIRHGGNLTGWRRGHSSTFDLPPWGRFEAVLHA